MMMATTGPPSSSSFLPLLESVEDSAAGQSEQTDAYLTIANRLSGEEGRHFLPAVETHFSRLGKAILAHINSTNTELSQAALQALGFCVYHSHVASGLPEFFATEILSALCSLVVKSTDKNTCTRALWVISKQSFPPEVVADKVSSILGTLENVWSREDVQSVVMEHEALNVVIRLLEQVPAQMGDRAVQWVKLVIPLVVHSASKVRLRAAAAMEMGMPLLLGTQAQVAAIIEPLMSSKLIPELQKLFMSKNETNVLKLWPLFVKLLGKLLHRGGPFINSLLHLEELGFRSSSPTIKKIAFIAWKSLIDNFALNPDILCSAKRMKLLMQPLTSINVKTETLLLTKVEVWWYLVVQLGPNLSSNFDQVSVPLLQCTIGSDSSSVPVTPSRSVNQNAAATPGTAKAGSPGFNSSIMNSSVMVHTTFPSIQLLGLEMLLHYFLGPEAVVAAAKYKLSLSLEPLTHPLLSGALSFAKHAAVLISNIRDGFTAIGKDAPDPLLAVLWKSLARFVSLTIESGGSKKERQGCEVLTLMLQALQSIVTSEALPAARVLFLFETTVKGIPQRVLGSASYQVGKMDVLNGTPALFLLLLLYNSSMLSAYIEDERFFQCLQTLVSCGLSGPTSPLAFAEAVLGAIGRSAGSVQNKEQLFRMWSVVVTPLTDTITQSNEVNQGDALEHNFSATHSALLFPVTHLLRGAHLQQAAQKSMLSAWSKLYKVFARCSALVVTAEENICCEELCAKMAASLDTDALMVPSTLNAVANILQVMVECVDFSPYTPQFQQKLKSPHTPVNWMRKRSKALGNLSTFQSLLVQCLKAYLEGPEASAEPTGAALVSILSALFTNLVLANAVQEALTSLIQPLTLFYKLAASDQPRFTAQLLGKLEKLVSEVLGCLQSRSTLAYDDELLALLSPLLCVLFPHKNKQLRTSVAQFWNSTFANSLSLTYPDEMRPILSQVKQKTPIILPGFEVVVVPDELSDQYSSESSQLETKLSGMPVSSVGKRDSLMGKDQSSTKTNKPVSTKLDFGSPKPPRKEVLEEEASIDFVFIPPETKERVLTEHQKEVKRTKRVDIPAMYNNLDASQDTAVFTQYTQSQEDSSDMLPTEQANNVTEEAPGKVPQEDVDEREDAEGLAEDTQDYASPEAAAGTLTEKHQQEETTPQSNVSVEEKTTGDERAEDMDVQSKEHRSLRHSRRQYFITLEKYPEGKPASPSGMSTFTGPLIKTSNSQERSNTDKTSSSRASHTATSPDCQDSSSTRTREVSSQSPLNDAPESPRRPKDSRIKSEPVRLTERMSSDSTEDECVIPDTPVEAQGQSTTQIAPKLEEIKSSSQKEGSELSLGDSQSPELQTSAGKPRRSGRNRVKPLLPELPSDSTEDECVIPDTPTELQGRNSKQMDSTLQEMDHSSQKEDSEPSLDDSQSSVIQTSPDERCKVRQLPELCSDTAEDECLIPDTQCEVQDEMTIQKSSTLEEMKNSSQKEESEPTLGDSQSPVIQTSPGESRRPGRYRGKPPLPGEKTDKREDKHTQLKRKRSGEALKTDSPKSSSVQKRPNTRSKQAAEEENSRVRTRARSESSQTNSQDRVKKRIKLFSSSADFLDTPERRRRSTREHESSQTELQSGSQSDYDSPSQGRRRRQSKPSDKSDNKYPLGVQSLSNSQTVVSPESHVEAKFGGRTRKSKVEEDLSSPRSTPKSSRSLKVSGSTESSSKGRGRYARRRSSQVANMESSESESSEVRESSPVVKKRGRKPRVSLQSPLALEYKDKEKDLAKDEADLSQQADTQSIEAENMKDLEDSQNTPDLQGSESLQVTSHAEEQINESLSMEVEADPVLAVDPRPLKTEIDIKKTHVSPRKQEPRDTETNACNTLLQETDIGDVEMLESVGISHEQNQEKSMDSAVDTLVPPGDTTDRLQVSESPEEKAEDVPETGKKNEDMAEAGEKDEDVSETEKAEAVSETGERDEDVSETREKTEDKSETGERNKDVAETEKSEAVSKPGEEDEDVSETEAVSETGERDEDVSETKETTEAVSETGERIIENQTDVSDQQEHPVLPVADTAGADHCTSAENHAACPDVVDELSKGGEQFPSKRQTETSAEGEITSVLEDDNGSKIPTAGLQWDMETRSANTENSDAALRDVCNAPVSAESTDKEGFQDSPEKRKDLEAVAVSDAGQSPINGKTKGTWSPSASPSTSILKKSQKRPLEEETPSPLIKSRRVSFADPIQQQETADDIDRRSPAIRTSSPRRSRLGGSQPKYVSTPTKGSVILSPRHLHSPGYKSSKKCLISEMSQEPRPVPRDCVYPALVGCSTPVEAVLPQISSTMWSRGFGQLVRARNIKTVGDLSALTPSDVKTLPIRSPKISNVKKALKVYEQQRKGRGGDELKSFDETEMMTSEPEESSAPQNQDEEEKTGETLATELLDEPVPADETPEPTCSGNPTLDTLAGEQQLHPDGLLSEVEALTCRMTPGELGRCSPPQLVQMHDRLGDMMRRLVVELQTRLCHIDGRP